MERRKFLSRGTMAALALSMMPKLALFAKNPSGVHSIPLTGTHTHIRHGLLQFATGKITKSKCHWLNSIEKNTFLRNGLLYNDPKFIHYNIDLVDDKLRLGIDHERILLEYDGQIHTLMQGKNIILKCGKTITGISLNENSTFDKNLNGDSLIIPMDGETYIQNKILENGNCFYVDKTISGGQLFAKNKSRIIIIT